MSRVVTVHKSLGSYSDQSPAREVNMERSDIPALLLDLQKVAYIPDLHSRTGRVAVLLYYFTGVAN